jgi:hypothetical protein
MMADPSVDMTTIAALVDLEKRSNGVIPITVESTGQAQGMVDQLEGTASSYTLEYVTQLNDQSGGQFQGILDQWKDVSGKDGVITRQAFIEMQLAIQNPDAIRNWAASQGLYVPQGTTDAGVTQMYGGQYVNSLNLDASNAELSVAGTRKVTKTSSGGSGEDPKLKKLQDQQEKKQKALDVIAIREDRINKKYDERKKALQEIADAQAKITEQQKNQMDLADALASGDVAAAVRAAQAIQAKNAEVAAQKQQDALEASRKKELDNVSFRGMTRGGLEPQLDKLKEQIAIREYELAPKKQGGGGGGTYTTTEKTEKPASPPEGFKATDGSWVYNNSTKMWDWKPNAPTIAPRPATPALGAPATAAPGVDPFQQAMTSTSNFFTQTIPNLAAGMWSGLQGIGTWLGEQWTGFQTWLGELPYNIGVAAGNIWNFIKDMGSWLGDQWTNISLWFTETLPQGIAELGVNIWNGIKSAGDWLATQWTNLVTWFQNLPETIKKAVKDLGAWWSKILPEIGTWLGDRWDDILKWFKDLPKNIADGVKKTWEGVTGWFGDIWGKVVSGFNSTQKADGGYISGPGTGTSDSIPARLSNGEYVIKAAAVNKVGVPFLNSVNDMKGFANGGYVMKSTPSVKTYATGGSVSNSESKSAASVYNSYSVTVNAGSSASPEDIANAVIGKIKRSETQRIGGR